MLDEAVTLIKALHGITRLGGRHHRLRHRQRGRLVEAGGIRYPEECVGEGVASDGVVVDPGLEFGVEGVDPAAAGDLAVAIGTAGERNGQESHHQAKAGGGENGSNDHG